VLIFFISAELSKRYLHGGRRNVAVGVPVRRPLPQLAEAGFGARGSVGYRVAPAATPHLGVGIGV
jgi:hypothetical protein